MLTVHFDKPLAYCHFGDKFADSTVYASNAMAACCYDWEDDKGEHWQVLKWFFNDLEHAKACLGLKKGSDCIFDVNNDWELVIYTNKCDANQLKDMLKLGELMLKAGKHVTVKKTEVEW